MSFLGVVGGECLRSTQHEHSADTDALLPRHLEVENRPEGEEEKHGVECHADAVQGDLQVVVEPVVHGEGAGEGVPHEVEVRDRAGDEHGEDGEDNDIDGLKTEHDPDGVADADHGAGEDAGVEEEDGNANRGGHGGVEEGGCDDALRCC